MEDLLPQFVPGSSSESENDDDLGQQAFRATTTRQRVDDPQLPNAAVARRRVTFTEDAANAEQPPSEAAPSLDGNRPLQGGEGGPAAAAAAQQVRLAEASRKRHRQKNISSLEVHALLQKHWQVMHQKQFAFNHVNVEALSQTARNRYARLINTSNWSAEVDENCRNVDDVLLPETLSTLHGDAATAMNAQAAVERTDGTRGRAPLFRLKLHQVRGVRFMWRLLVETPHEQLPAVGCILAHSMGLGKTAQVIVFIHLFIGLIKRQRGGSAAPGDRSKLATVAMVVPKSTKAGWESEVVRWSAHFPPEDRMILIEVDERLNREERIAKLRRWRERGGVLLIGYEALSSLVLRSGAIDIAGADGDPAELETDLLVCDEAHRLKSSDLQCAVALGKLHARRRLLLSGTPMQNHLLEYWAMVDFCLPKYFDRKTFLRHFVRPIQQSVTRSATLEEVARAKRLTFTLVKEMESFVQRVDSKPLQDELPKLHEFVITVPLSSLQAGLYNSFLDILRESKSDQFNVLQAFAYASKICAHPLMLFNALSARQGGEGGGGFASLPNRYDALAKLRPADYMPKAQEGHKLLLAVEIIFMAIERNEKTLVFSMSTQLLDYFETLLQQVSVERFHDATFVKFVRIDGSTSGQDRANLIHAFEKKGAQENGGFHVFLLSTRAGGVGITLTAATRIIMLDTSFNPSDDRQAIGRAYRYGQTKPVFAYRLVCRNTIEHRIFDQKVAKEWLFQTVVDQHVVKRDALSGVKLQQIFLMNELKSGTQQNEDGRTQRQTDRCCAEDPIIAGIRAGICSAVSHSSFFEDDDDDYGEDEAAYYERYKKLGGLTAFAEDPVQAAQREAAAAGQRNLIHSQARNLTNVLEDIMYQRAQANPRVQELLENFGVPSSSYGARRQQHEEAEPTARGGVRHVVLNGRAVVIPPRPLHLDQFARSCRQAYDYQHQHHVQASRPAPSLPAASREHAVEISDDDDEGDNQSRQRTTDARDGSEKKKVQVQTPQVLAATTREKTSSSTSAYVIDVDDDDDA